MTFRRCSCCRARGVAVAGKPTHPPARPPTLPTRYLSKSVIEVLTPNDADKTATLNKKRAKGYRALKKRRLRACRMWIKSEAEMMPQMAPASLSHSGALAMPAGAGRRQGGGRRGRRAAVW